MIRIQGIFIVLLFSMTAWSQKGSWIEKQIYPMQADGVWSVDGLENVYIAQFGLINKFDSTGKLKFSQSIKSLGSMTQLVPINTMKLIHFSEEQQTLCYLDNTLSPLDDCIDLTEEGIVNAVMVSESNQPNKIWVLDNLNSRLLLLPLDNVYQTQELVNLRGVLDLNQVTQFVERNNQVVLLDATKGVYIFDLYGSLLDYFPEKNVLAVDANEQMLFLLRADGLYIRSFASGETLRVDVPVTGVIDFAYRNHFFFFRTEKAVHKFALQFSE
ncbi:MAG: hypothetical protein A3D92_13545 [Bacteroidetes bacterium RIFCSPHIGHO2_02_FULL_44_7]|nr:MAG: hypothetical protein A3D92_13545 [Bacteroidetes bacterium RIFCSPHIGHO2_02_FULL_44_7]